MKRDYAVGLAAAGRYQHLIAHAPRRPQPIDAPEARAWFTSSQAIWAAVLRCDNAQVDAHWPRRVLFLSEPRALSTAHESAPASRAVSFFYLVFKKNNILLQGSSGKDATELEADLGAFFSARAAAVGLHGKLLPAGSAEGAGPRLWANTELAAFLLFDPLDFRL
jgi:hypothetical protein